MNCDLDKAISIADRRWNEGEKRVMVDFVRTHNPKGCCRRHLRLRRDEGGLYVRLGRRGQVKRYLSDMAEAKIVDERLNVIVFYELKG